MPSPEVVFATGITPENEFENEENYLDNCPNGLTFFQADHIL